MDQRWAHAHDQFVLQRGPLVAPGGWLRRTAPTWTLVHHPSLPVTELTGTDGAVTAWVLGWMVAPDGRFAGDGHPPCDGSAAAVEALLDTCSGRFAVVALAAGAERVYLDACGTLATVYRPAQRRVASTVTTALWDEPDHPVFARPRGAFPSNGVNQYFPAGLTAVADVARLLPNHYLDLSTWEPVRHYPRDDLASLDEGGIDEAIDAMIRSIGTTLAAYASSYPHLYVGLTAGRDTRTVIACARAVIERVELVTFDYRPVRTDRMDRTDVFAWRRLMGGHPALRHLVPVGPVDPAVEDAYSWRIGWAGGPGKARDFDVACRRHLDLTGVWVTGFGGETGRAPYSAGVDLARPVSAEQLLRCLKLDRPELAEHVRPWYQGVAHLPVVSALDLGFLEHRVGAWASTHMYGAAPFAANVAPLTSRAVQDAMLRFPPHVKFGRDVVRDLVARAWPELAGFPVEGFTGWRRPVEAVRYQAGEWRQRRRVRRTAGTAVADTEPVPRTDELDLSGRP